MTRRAVLVVAIAIVAGARGAAAAGELAHCDPAPTAVSEVARAKVVVVAKATARTRHVGDGNLRTTLSVTRVVRGALAAHAITVDDCDDWKCTGLDVARGKTVVLLLVPGEHRGHFEPLGPRCQNGFQRSVLPYDPADPDVKAVLAAAAPSP